MSRKFPTANLLWEILPSAEIHDLIYEYSQDHDAKKDIEGELIEAVIYERQISEVSVVTTKPQVSTLTETLTSFIRNCPWIAEWEFLYDEIADYREYYNNKISMEDLYLLFIDFSVIGRNDYKKNTVRVLDWETFHDCMFIHLWKYRLVNNHYYGLRFRPKPYAPNAAVKFPEAEVRLLRLKFLNQSQSYISYPEFPMVETGFNIEPYFHQYLTLDYIIRSGQHHMFPKEQWLLWGYQAIDTTEQS